jgi:imidazolonepropionase-like amidohydrolase
VLVGGLATALSPASRAAPPGVPTVIDGPHRPDAGSLALQCGRLVDGVASSPRGASTVVIREGRIAAVTAGFHAPTGLPVLDLRQHTCLPGLIDMHTHLTERPGDTADLSVYFRRTQPSSSPICARANAGDAARRLHERAQRRHVHRWADLALRDADRRRRRGRGRACRSPAIT